MEVLLDGHLMISREALHDMLQKELSLPGHYGRNLDALYDVLSECPHKLEITLIHTDEMLSNLGKYGHAFIKTLWDASSEYPNVNLSISNEII